MRIPIPASLEIEEFNGGRIVVAESMVKNGVYEKDAKGEWSITQRPAVNVAQDPTDESVTAVRGRGLYDWAAVDAEYFVNNNEVYKGTYGTTVREAAQSVTLEQTGGTATATATAHGYLVGDTVVIADAVETEYNGTHTILTVPDADTFTFSVDSGASSPATGTITARRAFTAGTDKVYFHEVGDYLVILDPENNEGWYIESGSSTVLHKITDADFPPNQTPAKTLCKGGAAMNGRLHVGSTDGTISGCDSLDPTSWNALTVLSAEYKPDDLVNVFEHDQYLAAGGTRTTEYFVDVGNATGSTLSPVTHVQHAIGIADEDCVWESGGVTYFLGQSATGEIGAYEMSKMAIRKVSTTDIDSFLTTSITTELKRVAGSGYAIGGRVFYLLSTYHIVNSQETPVPTALTTLAYEATTGTWSVMGLMQLDNENAPVIDWTKATRTEIGKGILLDGKIVTIADDFIPNDRTISTGWVSSGWVTSGWVSNASTEGTPIRVDITMGRTDLGTVEAEKFASWYSLVGTLSGRVGEVNQYVSLSWSNETNRDFGTARNFDPSNPKHKATRCGRFMYRNHKIVFALENRILFKGLEAGITLGNS